MKTTISSPTLARLAKILDRLGVITTGIREGFNNLPAATGPCYPVAVIVRRQTHPAPAYVADLHTGADAIAATAAHENKGAK